MHVICKRQTKKKHKGEREREREIRVLEAVAALVAAEELVRETDVAAHATNDLKIHHYSTF